MTNDTKPWGDKIVAKHSLDTVTDDRVFWYRYEGNTYENGDHTIDCYAYPVIGETAKTVVLQVYAETKRVLKDAVRRYAYPTQELALDHFYHRKKRQVLILGSQYDRAQFLRAQAKAMIKAGFTDYKAYLADCESRSAEDDKTWREMNNLPEPNATHPTPRQPQ